MPRDAYTLSVAPLGHWKACSLVHATSATGQYATCKRGTNANAAQQYATAYRAKYLV